MTAAELRKCIGKKEIGIEETVRGYLERIAKYDGPDGLNAVARLNPEAIGLAREMDRTDGADKPLWGLPVLVKDNIDVAGMETTAGSFALSGNIARKDAKVIENLKRNGAIILGKTNMTEFANFTTRGMPGGYSSGGGQVKNAYESKASPSGSSSGSAVAMSAGLCAMAVGTDTSFSVVGCATFNGVVGFKPAIGALSAEGIVPIAHTLDSAGALTACVQDAILLADGMRCGRAKPVEAADVRGLRIAVNGFGAENVSQEQSRMRDGVLDALRSDGAVIGNVRHAYVRHQMDVMKCEFGEDLAEYLAGAQAGPKTLREIIAMYEERPEMAPYGIELLQESAVRSRADREYGEAMRERERLRAELLGEMAGYDAIVMTGPTNVMHFLGIPSIALKMGMGADGMPRGLILYGADEGRLLSAALAMEKYCGDVSAPVL